MRSVKQVMEYCSEASSILIYSILLHQAWKIVKFTSDKSVIRVVRRLHNEKLDSINLQFKIFFGRPNLEEREFIKKCKKAGERFPIKDPKIYLPKKK